MLVGVAMEKPKKCPKRAGGAEKEVLRKDQKKLKTNGMMRNCSIIVLVVMMLIMGGCAAPRLSLFPDETAPLREFTLEGTEKGKVVVISVEGMISDTPEKRFLRPKPSMVQEIVSQLRLAERDKEVKAVLFKINSPGGSTTASDLLYHEIMEYKRRTQAKVVVSMMNLATSGGYYISLPVTP